MAIEDDKLEDSNHVNGVRRKDAPFVNFLVMEDEECSEVDKFQIFYYFPAKYWLHEVTKLESTMLIHKCPTTAH